MDSSKTSIRLAAPGDAEALAAHFARDAEAFARWDPPWPDGFVTTAGQRSRIERMLMRLDEGASWPGVVLAGDVVIGQVTVQNILRRVWQKAEIGYWIGTPHQGQGHATRAVALAVEVMTGQLGLHRAEAYTQMDNLGSQHVLRSNGFVPFGVARARMFTAGAWRDDIVWELLLDQD